MRNKKNNFIGWVVLFLLIYEIILSFFVLHSNFTHVIIPIIYPKYWKPQEIV